MTLVYVYNQYGGAPVKGKHVYVNENKTVWQKVDGGRDDLSDKFALISTNDTPLQSKLLPAGNHKFALNFHCHPTVQDQLPILFLQAGLTMPTYCTE